MGLQTALKLLLLGYGLTALAKEPKRDPAPSYALSTCNFRDLAMDGYCLGVSSIHAVSRMPEDKIKSVFGDEIARAFRDHPAQNDQAALKLLRVFSLLQMEGKYVELTKNTPEIPTRKTLEANDKLLSIKSLRYANPLSNSKDKWDHQASTQEANRQIDQIFQFLQTEKGKSQGVLGNLIVASPGPTLVGRHSVYFVSAKKKGTRYEFLYLDPNHPQKLNSLIYDERDSSTRFSTDSKSYYSILTEFLPVDAAFGAYSEIVSDLQKSPSDRSKMLLSFLRLQGGTENSNAVYRDKAMGDDAALFNKWNQDLLNNEKRVADLHAESRKYFQITDPFKLAESSRIDKAKEELAISSYLSLVLAAQNQLDLGCDNFKKFFTQFLDQLDKPAYRDPKLMDIADSRDFPVLPGSYSMYLFQKVLDWGSMATPDGKRVGRIPEKNLQEQECIRSVALPLLAKQVAKTDTLFWSFALDKSYFAWLLSQYDWLTADRETRALLRANIEHLNPEMILEFILHAALSSNSKLKNNAFIAFQDLNAVHRDTRVQWARDLKNSSTEFPKLAAHRDAYLLNSLSLPTGETWDGNRRPWSRRDLPKNFQREVQAFSRGWAEFFKNNKPQIIKNMEETAKRAQAEREKEDHN